MNEPDSTRLNCLFWNLNRKDRGELICDLVKERDIAVLILAETGEEPLLPQLQERVEAEFFEPASEILRLKIIARNSSLLLKEVYADTGKRLTMRSLLIDQKEILFAAVHLVSKQNWDDRDQAAEVCVLAHQIRDQEKRRGHSRTILLGDLNMNPFDPGVVQATGFHAAMTKTTALSESRVVQGREYPFFYNPMWGFFGDRTPGPPGTHYYRGGHVSYDWNIYDQVLIRPEAFPWFDDTIEIVTKVGEIDLLKKNGQPDPNVGSDHLPIIFGLKCPRMESSHVE